MTRRAPRTLWGQKRLTRRFLRSPEEVAPTLSAPERHLILQGILSGRILCLGPGLRENLLVSLLSHRCTQEELALFWVGSSVEVKVGQVLRTLLAQKEGRERAEFFGDCHHAGVAGQLRGTITQFSYSETREQRYHRRLYRMGSTGAEHAALWEEIEKLPAAQKEIFECLLVGSDDATPVDTLLDAARSL